MATPIPKSEAGRRGGLATAAGKTPEQRRDQARRAHLASAVSAIVSRWPELSPEQVARLRPLLTSGATR